MKPSIKAQNFRHGINTTTVIPETGEPAVEDTTCPRESCLVNSVEYADSSNHSESDGTEEISVGQEENHSFGTEPATKILIAVLTEENEVIAVQEALTCREKQQKEWKNKVTTS